MASARLASSPPSLPAWARTAGRAVHIKIHPRPRNLAESRQILHLLQGYGEVVSYQHLKVYLPSSLLNVTGRILGGRRGMRKGDEADM